MQALLKDDGLVGGRDWCIRGWPQPSCVRCLGAGEGETNNLRGQLYDIEKFTKYNTWFRGVFESAPPEARARAGFAWRRDRDGESLIWCAGLELEGIMLLRFEACALLESACA